uniref:Interferon-related developmental regulator 1 n=1 Tax=Parascaris univalens TaxID=6257 RepID=A0A914ZHN1_PARUN
MGGKRRNRNKIERDDRASAPSSSHKPPTVMNESDESEAESFATHLTLDDDLQSVIVDADEIDDEEVECGDSSAVSTRLSDYLDNATHKNISIRLAAMDNIQLMLTKHCIAEELDRWRTTVLDLIEKALRKTDEESYRAALLAALVSLHLGDSLSEEIEPVVTILRQMCTDTSRVERLRAQFAHSLALCTYLCVEQPASLSLSASALRTVWTTTKCSAASTALFSAAVAGWSLLIHQAGRRTLESALLDEPKLCTFVDGAQVDMRVSAGEALTVLYEAAVETMGVAYRFPNQQHLLEVLASLSTDSVKFRAKKDRRVQRFSFRQIYNAIKDQEPPSMVIKFGGETLELDSCGKKLLYDMLCAVLRGGMNIHLKSNLMLRELFDLGPIQEHLPAKMTKLQRMAVQNAVNKTRDLQRAKQRDKRTC